MSSCPHFESSTFNPVGPGMIADPFAVLALAREECPVFYIADYDMWCVTRYEDVKTIFSDPVTYSSKNMVRVWPVPAETAPFLLDGHPMEGAPVTTDPPRHTEIRRLAQKAFTPNMVTEREPAIRDACERLIAKFADKGSVDLIPAYTAEIPPWVVTQLLGVPEKDTMTFRNWALEAHHLAFAKPDLSPEGVLELSRKLVPFDQYISELINARRVEPREDLTSYFVHAETDEGDPRLTQKELKGLIVSVVTAGSDTTSTLIGHCVYLLLRSRERWDEVRADRSLISTLIGESMRLHSPARAMRRTTTRKSTIGGVDVPEGATLFLHLASANRDESVFPDPDIADLHRGNAHRHLGFGHGPHFCLGAVLARLEATVALDVLLDKLPTLRLANEKSLEDDDYDRNPFIPSLHRLHVEWDVESI